jgi:Leucine-rich repeat (LRR) protein
VAICRSRDHLEGCYFHYIYKSCYLPKFPPHVTALDLSRSYDHELDINRDFFKNVSHITYLDFSFNKVDEIKGNPFLWLTNLTTLVWNQVGLIGFELTLLKPLTLLEDLEMMNNFGHSGVDQINVPRLQRLLLDDYQGLYLYNLSSFCTLRNLKELSLNGTDIEAFTECPLSVEVLSLASNSITKFPETCFDRNSSLFPQLATLDLSNTAIPSIPSKVCLPKLQYLSLSVRYGVPLALTLEDNTFSTANFPNLQVLFAGDATIPKHTLHPFHNRALEYLFPIQPHD